MKVIIKKQTMVNGQTVEASDEPMEFPSEIAVQLINAQKAVLVPAPVKVRNREQAIEETIETRIAAAADIEDVAQGDTLENDDIVYNIVNIQPDGTGTVLLILEKDDSNAD